MIIAHSSPDGRKPPQSLEKHTIGVLARALKFSNSFDPYGITAISAIAHDLGKITDEFQKYIRSENKQRGSVKHALGGTLILNSIQDDRAALGGLIVSGHHAGLPDASRLNQERLPSAPSYLKALLNKDLKEKKVIQNLLSLFSPLPNIQAEDGVYIDFLIKMCFSALVDADFLDTEAYMDEGRSNTRFAVAPLSLENLYEKFKHHMKRLTEKVNPTALNQLRSKVYNSCIKEGSTPESFRSLNVPTGLGKTLASMGYALEHPKTFKKSRVIVAIPFTSIIDQNAQVYKQIFGSESVLEHHSQVTVGNDEFEDFSQRKLAAENWDMPIILTTTVQLFESIFSNRPGRCRKLHNIANSVIILDEFQKLPMEVLKPIFTLLKIMMKKFNVTVLVSSATPLSFERRELFGNIDPPVEICPYNSALFEEMKRVNYSLIPGFLSAKELVNLMRDHHQLLCIVNTKKDALLVFQEMKAMKTDEKRDFYHLSTSMVPHHRKKTIENIWRDLHAGKSLVVVSTQLIEAGVDFDFPVVYRAMGPLDSIVQAGGRCNREGKLRKGNVFLFELEGGGMPAGTYRKGAEQTRQLLKIEGVENLHKLELYNQYFRSLYSLEGEDGLDGYQITTLNPFSYEKVNERFKMINQQTVSVLCRFYQDEVASSQIEKLIQEAADFPHLSKSWCRKAQQFSVSLYKDSRFLRDNKQYLKQLSEEWFIWEGRYDLSVGITYSLEYNPDELVV